MRFARTIIEGREQYVVSDTDDDRWTALSALGFDIPDLPALCEQASAIREATLDTTDRGTTIDSLLCPVVRPSKILAIGLNYRQHARETGAALPERPIVFAKYPNALNGPYSDVTIGPSVTGQADYEAELAVIIGTRATCVKAKDASDYIFGYAVADDVSSRDWQKLDAQFSRSKSADTFCPIGPWLTAAEDVVDPADLRIMSFVNGEPRQDSNTGDLIFGIGELIEFLTTTVTLEPGDVLLTGTPAGVGMGFTPPRYLQPGDTVECRIEGLGAIRNNFISR